MSKYISTYKEFVTRAPLLMGDDFGFEVSIIACAPLGWFSRKRAEELVAFCKENPEYHIVSYVGHAYFNCLVPTASFFFLARGENDPNLVHYPRYSFAAYQRRLVKKLWRDKPAAINKEVNGCPKPKIFSHILK